MPLASSPAGSREWSTGSVADDSGGAAPAPERIRTAVTWLAVLWTAVLCWVYVTGKIEFDDADFYELQ